MQIHQIMLQVGVTSYVFEGVAQQHSKHDVSS